MANIHLAATDLDYQSAAVLFREYAEWLNIDLTVQHFDEELGKLKEMYGEPDGAIFLDKLDGEVRGCVAVRRLSADSAELKRMYIPPAFRKQGIAESLLERAINFAREKNYISIKLDTLDNMVPAISLYRKFGFRETEAYYNNPNANTVYFEKRLDD
jgi:carbonic anhydrase